MSKARNRADANAPDDSITSADLAPDIVLTGGSVGVPSVTTANRPGESGGTNASQTATVGMIIYNTTIGMLQQYNAQGWASIDSPPTVSSLNYPGDDTALDTVGVFTDATCDYNNDPTIAHDTNSNMKVGMSVSGTGIPADATIASVTSTTAFELSASTTGGAVTNGTLTFNSQTLIITGTNFQTGVTVTIDGTAPSTVTRDSSTQITVTGTPAKTAGTKVDGLVVTNTSGLAASINVDYSALPAWTTASGNVLSSFILGSAISTVDLAATSATSYAITTGALAPGLAMSTSTGDITGTITGSTYTTYNFTVTATDAEAQSSPRLFNIIVSTLPTGGVITTYTGFRVHTFLLANTGQNFVFTATMSIDVLVVGAGGGGGWDGGGGGGAGGMRISTISATAQAYTITVGTGGAGGISSSRDGEIGGSSIFPGVTSYGGGGGAGAGSGNAPTGTYGSGGGGYRNNNSYTGAAGTSGQGNTGGNGSLDTGRGGGGGGAGEVGNYDAQADGGDGSTNAYRTGSNVTYAGGGGGAGNSGAGAGSGGDGGGGAGNPGGDGAAGSADTGGGGGARGASGGTVGGLGGSGIVVIRYAV